jgi:mRNA interferase MazF
MKRGEVWTVAGAGYTGKPRPAVVLQDDRFDTTASITVCPLTTDITEAVVVRPSVDPDDRNGLRAPSRFMADKIMTVQRVKVGSYVGQLDHADIVRLNRAVMVFLGLAD